VAGKRIVATRHAHTVTIRETHAAPAIEIMSRYAVDPRWLVYLPPTMSPSETAKDGPELERPREAFEYFRSQGVARVVCEQKHMGSRAVVVVCKSADTAAARFGVRDGRSGVVYTRTGRPFFTEPALERGLLERVRAAADGAGLWDELRTDWLCLDAELMPWSAKARELVRSQYAAVGAAGTSALAAAVAALASAPGAEDLRRRFEARREALVRFRRAYRGYCWEAATLDDLELAPFHVLAAEGRVFIDEPHTWHMQSAARLAAADTSGLLLATPCLEVELHDEASVAGATRWWTDLTERGGEGMVVKPLEWIVRGPKGLVQPALKCRGPEYLRIIYGAEYDAPEHLERLRSRHLHTKRNLAIKEYALGLEALHRFVEREPLHRVHECVFGVLALETEPVDPRL
jgi:protein phosphatase